MKVGRIADSKDHITELALNNSMANLVPVGSVLVVIRSGILRHTLPVAVTVVPVSVNQDLKALTPGVNILSEYVAWALRAFGGDIFKRCAKQGTTVNSVDTAKLLRYEIPVAPLEQQGRIVAEIEKQFSRLDEAVAKLKRVNANLKRYRAAVLKAAVEGRLVPTEAELARREGRSYETGEQLLVRILATRQTRWDRKRKYREPVPLEETYLIELPEGWTRASLSQLGEVTTGFTPPTSDPENFARHVPFFKPTDLDAGYDTSKAREYLSKKGLLHGRPVAAGSVLVTCIGATIGKTGLTKVDCATNQQINALTLQDTGVISEFAFWWMVSVAGQRQIRENASATTLPILNKSKFESLVMPIPPALEQRRIVLEVERRLSMADESEAQVEAGLRRAEGLRRAILKQAFEARLG